MTALSHGARSNGRKTLTTRRLTTAPVDEVGEEVHPQGAGELRGGEEGDVDVVLQDGRHVGPRHVHATRQLGLVDAEPLHLLQDAAQERRTDLVHRSHVNAHFNISLTEVQGGAVINDLPLPLSSLPLGNSTF